MKCEAAFNLQGSNWSKTKIIHVGWRSVTNALKLYSSSLLLWHLLSSSGTLFIAANWLLGVHSTAARRWLRSLSLQECTTALEPQNRIEVLNILNAAAAEPERITMKTQQTSRLHCFCTLSVWPCPGTHFMQVHLQICPEQNRLQDDDASCAWTQTHILTHPHTYTQTRRGWGVRWDWVRGGFAAMGGTVTTK